MYHDKRRKSQNFLTATIFCELLLLIFGTQTAHAASIGNDNANNDALVASSNTTSTDINTSTSTTLAEHATILPYSILNDMKATTTTTKTTTAEPTIEHEATTLLNLPVSSAVNNVDSSMTSFAANFPQTTEEPLIANTLTPTTTTATTDTSTTLTTTTTNNSNNLLHDSSDSSLSTTSTATQSNGESNCLRYIDYNEQFKFAKP